MTDRRDNVRRCWRPSATQPFNTQQNTCAEILDFCHAFGCETELADTPPRPEGQRHYRLCWNMPCGGYELMTISEGHLAPRVGYGYQNDPFGIGGRLGPLARPDRLSGPGRQDRSHGGRPDRI